jgi:hypothetical protein
MWTFLLFRVLIWADTSAFSTSASFLCCLSYLMTQARSISFQQCHEIVRFQTIVFCPPFALRFSLTFSVRRSTGNLSEITSRIRQGRTKQIRAISPTIFLPSSEPVPLYVRDQPYLLTLRLRLVFRVQVGRLLFEARSVD